MGNAQQNLSRPGRRTSEPRRRIPAGTRPHAPRARLQRRTFSRRTSDGERLGRRDALPPATIRLSSSCAAVSGRLRAALLTFALEIPSWYAVAWITAHPRSRIARCRSLHALQKRLHFLSEFLRILTATGENQTL